MIDRNSLSDIVVTKFQWVMLPISHDLREEKWLLIDRDI